LLLFGIVLVLTGSIKNRNKISLLITMIGIIGMFLVSCGDSGGGGGTSGNGTSGEVSYTVSGLSGTYYWKVIAKDIYNKESMVFVGNINQPVDTLVKTRIPYQYSISRFTENCWGKRVYCMIQGFWGF